MHWISRIIINNTYYYYYYYLSLPCSLNYLLDQFPSLFPTLHILYHFSVYGILSTFLPCCSLFLSPLRGNTISVRFSCLSSWEICSHSRRFETGKHYEQLTSSWQHLERDSFSFLHLPLTHRLLGWCEAVNSSQWKVREVVSINLFLHFMLSSGGLIF